MSFSDRVADLFYYETQARADHSQGASAARRKNATRIDPRRTSVRIGGV
jgi:hypothetical protein